MLHTAYIVWMHSGRHVYCGVQSVIPMCMLCPSYTIVNCTQLWTSRGLIKLKEKYNAGSLSARGSGSSQARLKDSAQIDLCL